MVAVFGAGVGAGLDLGGVLTDAVRQFAAEVQAGTYPGAEHSYH